MKKIKPKHMFLINVAIVIIVLIIEYDFKFSQKLALMLNLKESYNIERILHVGLIILPFLIQRLLNKLVPTK